MIQKIVICFMSRFRDQSNRCECGGKIVNESLPYDIVGDAVRHCRRCGMICNYVQD